MSIATASTAAPTIDITSDERTQRLEQAEQAWGERLAADAANGRLVFAAAGIAEGSVATRIRAGRHEWLIDEPAALAGDDAGTSPVEAALGALLACQTVVYRLYAQRLGLTIDSLEL